MVWGYCHMTFEKREIAQAKGPNDNAILIPIA